MRLSTATLVLCMSNWLLPFLVVLQQQPAQCRYLPTRSHTANLDKLRELMLQILESSKEDQFLQHVDEFKSDPSNSVNALKPNDDISYYGNDVNSAGNPYNKAFFSALGRKGYKIDMPPTRY